MKNYNFKAAYCTIFLLLFNLTSFSQETWNWSYPSPQGNSLNSVTWVSGSVFIAVGDHGTILRSTNDGASWASVSSGVINNLNKVKFASSTTGYIVGTSGVVLKTTDGGLSWSQATSPDANELKAVYFTSESVGYIGNSLGTLYKTTNGGSGWVPIYSGAGNITSIQFLDAQNGFLGSNSGFFKTSNGGTDWTSPSNPNITDMVFIDALNGWYVDQSGLFKTTDGGMNWVSNLMSNENSYTTGVPNSIVISNTNIFLAGSLTFVDKLSLSGSLITTFNKLWGVLNSVAVSNFSVVIAVGEAGNIYKSTNNGIEWAGILQEPNYYSLNSITKKQDGSLFAVGDKGSFLTSTDEGVSWNSINFTSSDINKLFFANENIGWCAAGRYLYKTSNGGTSWSDLLKFSGSTSHIYYDVVFFDLNNGILVGRASATAGLIQSSVDGGGGWTQRIINNPGFFYSAAYLSSKDTAFACGANGVINKTVNACTTWTSKTSNTNQTLYHIKFINSRIGYAVGAAGTIIKTTNGGEYWYQQESHTTSDLSDIRFYDEKHGIAVGSGGTVILTNDSGKTWIQKSLPTNNNLTEAVIINPTTAFIVGNNSTILKGASLSLPVELTSFSGSVRNNIVNLNWETATEVDNYGFEIERKDKHSDWSKIGFVEGYSTSNSPKHYSFSDKPTGTSKFTYRLKQIDNDGKFEYSDEVEVLIDNLPNGYLLEQNYPNPFNPETSIRFALKENTKATLKVYNNLGELVATLFDGITDAGRLYDLKFNGNKLASGFYFYKLEAGKYPQTRKMMLVK